jgi:hypothetical protein
MPSLECLLEVQSSLEAIDYLYSIYFYSPGKNMEAKESFTNPEQFVCGGGQGATDKTLSSYT